MNDEELKRQVLDTLSKGLQQTEKQDLQIMKVDLQISSNMKISVEVKDRPDDQKYTIGSPK